MRVLCSSRKPMRKKPVSGFPRALLSLSHARKRRALASRLHLSKLSHGNLRFAPGAEIEHVITIIFQPGGRGEISARAETHHVIRS